MKFPAIISGTRTGAERAAREWATANGVEHGAGGTGEQSVLRSAATVVFTVKAKPGRHARMAVRLARKHSRLWLHVHRRTRLPATMLESMVSHFRIRRLYVSGSTASEPGIGKFVRQILDQTAAFLSER